MAEVRYIVNDVEASIRFYVDQLGFTLDEQYGPAMAILHRDDLRLWVAGPPASASRPMRRDEARAGRVGAVRPRGGRPRRARGAAPRRGDDGLASLRVAVTADPGALDGLSVRWARFEAQHLLYLASLDRIAARLRDARTTFRNDVVTGPGGRQILCSDPSGNVVELFEPA